MQYKYANIDYYRRVLQENTKKCSSLSNNINYYEHMYMFKVDNKYI